MFRHFLFPLLWGCVVPLTAATVNVDRLNVRVAPALDAFVVASIAGNTALDVAPGKEAWAEIAAPAGVPVWVSSVFVSPEGRLLEGARLRCGPGVVYTEYKYVPGSDSKIKVLENARGKFWLRIQPPFGLKCYVSRKFLKEERPAIPVPTVQAPVSYRYVVGDERVVSLEGKLVPLAEGILDSSHELILEINNEKISVCYLTAQRLNLKLWEQRTVRVDGIQRWVKGVKRPFVEIEKVSPSWK